MIISPVGKIYIGQSIKLEKRLNDYKKLLNCKNQRLLYNSFLKYGAENHKFEIILYCPEYELDSKEDFYVSQFGTLDRKKGLNIRSGGRKGGSLSEETKLILSVKNKISMKGKHRGSENPFYGRKHSEESLQKMRSLQKGENNGFYGKTHSAETIQRLSEIGKTRIPIVGRTLSAKARKAIGDKNRGRAKTPQEIEMIRQKLKGRVFSEDHKQKLRDAWTRNKLSKLAL